MVKKSNGGIITAGKPVRILRFETAGTGQKWFLSNGKSVTVLREDPMKIMKVPKKMGEHGFLVFYHDANPINGGKGVAVYLSSVLTPLESRGKGYAIAMIQRMEVEAKKRNARLIWGNFLRSNTKFVDNLQRLDWREIAPYRLDPDCRPAGTNSRHIIVMAKEI